VESPGLDVPLVERPYAILRHEEWKGREEEVAQAIAHHVREGLMGYPGILQSPDAAFIKSVSEQRRRDEPPQDSNSISCADTATQEAISPMGA